MKLSSKSILSPSRSRETPQISLQSSLSRRLRNNGSMKGGQASPMFPTIGGKRRGCGFDNPEPSSPKVTCIGQVRVKTKKQGKKMRSRSKRRGGEVLSFRKSGGSEPDLIRQNSQSFQYQLQQQECLKHRNQRWVHLPLTICEALREFTCFFPCRSSCVSKEEKNSGDGERSNSAEKSGHGNVREGSCGAAFARWLVALHEGDSKGRSIELGMKEDDYENGRSERSYRHVLEDIDVEVMEEKNKKKFEEFEEEEEKGRVSICIPPKNALLLMRCRSDPVKMAALANRFWESPFHEDHDVVEKDEVDEDNEDEVEVAKEEEEEEEGGKKEHIESIRSGFVNNKEIQLEEHEVRKSCEIESQLEEHEVRKSCEIESDVVHHEPTQYKEVELEGEEKNESELGSVVTHEGEKYSSVFISTLQVNHADLEKPETEEEVEQPSFKNLKEGQENEPSSKLYPTPSTFIASELQNGEAQAESATMAEPEVPATMAEPETEASTEGLTEEQKENITVAAEISPELEEEADPTHNEPGSISDPGQENGSEKDERERLPECLLQMMCEPKVSMEVSKETWVCTTDFVRWLPPEKLAGKPDDGVVERTVRMRSKPNKKLSPQRFLQPPRYSCSFPVVPAEGILAGMIEQKVGPKTNNGYKPFVLTRCKSEPVRLSARA
ncbi:hypothetical protein Lal_00018218 [Lupinus albus]|uniref:Uncharacterized protein n=1 Tax=Lupinus albus TaxID=3870 RepID=A0A6A5M816_LUPAL|nr:hypothetical protein Lalb_Chr25g0286181 [Lupinus albus]KAF1866832.1 hypothetical protein Lal_00018218 [Lupinus albus]